MTYRRIPISGSAVVVAFDICSSSNIIEELTINADVRRLKDLLGAIKRYLAMEQDNIVFDPYKFTGDGWLLLFPSDTNGNALATFLVRLCNFYEIEYREKVFPFLAHPPSVSGLTFGIEKGQVESLTIYDQREYLGRVINIACRLQGAVKGKGGNPAYKALVSNAVFAEYFSAADFPKVFRVNRTLRNIDHGKAYQCRKIELLCRPPAVGRRLIKERSIAVRC
jgi:hypothetical protein